MTLDKAVTRIYWLAESTEPDATTLTAEWLSPRPGCPGEYTRYQVSGDMSHIKISEGVRTLKVSEVHHFAAYLVSEVARRTGRLMDYSLRDAYMAVIEAHEGPEGRRRMEEIL